MSGGQLVVLDRLGRDVKRYPLPEGLATIGSDPACDIRVMLSSVSPHHATVVVHANQTVVRNVSTGETLVNGQPVSVAALRHKDRIELGGRILRWEYSDAAAERPLAPEPAVHSVAHTRAARARRATAGAPAAPRDPAVRLQLEMTARASMPGGVGGKQVAIVQPQRRDTAEQNDQSPSRQYAASSGSKRARVAKSEGGEPSPPAPPAPLAAFAALGDGDKSKRKTPRAAGSPVTLQGTTKATLWIESRKSSPRKSTKPATPASAPPAPPAPPRRRAARSTPLRLTVLKRHRPAAKIQAPAEIDPTKQAAIMLMAGRSPRPALLVKRTPRGSATARSPRGSATPRKTAHTDSITQLEISDSRQSTSVRRSPPVLGSPKKSALKDPSVKKASRKTDSIKFDLSNLDNYDQSQDASVFSDTTAATLDDSTTAEDENITLHYDTSSVSPSPRRSIHSRSSRIMERTLGTSPVRQASISSQGTLTPGTPRNRKSSRGSIIVQKALDASGEPSKRYSTRTTKSVSDQSYETTVGSSFGTRTLSPRSPSQKDMESYSIVDLVSVDSPGSSSEYGSGRSRTSVCSSAAAFGTPRTSGGRTTRSTIDPAAVTSSTPYGGKKAPRATRSLSSPSVTRNVTVNDSSRTSRSTRRSKSLTTPENSLQVSMNATRVSRGPRSRSRINDSDLLLISSVTEVEDSSPKSSKRLSRNDTSVAASPLQTARTSARKTRLTVNVSPNSPVVDEGMTTPDDRGSPEEAGTPVLSIQSLLDSSHNSSTSKKSMKKGRLSKRNTIGGIQKKPKGRPGKSKSLILVARRSARKRSKESSTASDKTEEGAPPPGDEDIVTPKSAVKLVPEDVKNKHSTAKKPQSKRAIIDDLNESDIVKQLFNSPVKRKLSQSMSEYSRKQLLEEESALAARRPARHTLGARPALHGTEPHSPGLFVSPLSTPDRSPNLTGIKRLFGKRTPGEVPEAETSSRRPRARKSIKNDLTRVSGVKNIFAGSPRNRLSNVRVKELFAPSPEDDLRRVSGVKALFRTKTPNNDLRDVRGVKKLFSDNPVDDLRNVSGVKRTLRRNSPRNDLSDVRGVRKMFRQERAKADALSDVSGVEELFNESVQSSSKSTQSPRETNRSSKKSTLPRVESNRSHLDVEALFDQLLGKPPIKAVYSKTFSKKFPQKPKPRRAKSLHASIDEIRNNVEEWLERELQKRLKRNGAGKAGADKSEVSSRVSRELQKLATDTVEGTPLRQSRGRSGLAEGTRNSTVGASSQDSPGRKRPASQAYSARRLPLKKRSWSEAAPRSPSGGLPLKKRAVLHSTPVKGRGALLDGSELGRVSPIAAIDHTQHLHLTSTRTKDVQENELTEAASRTKSKIETSKSESLKVSPNKTRASETAKISPKKTRASETAKLSPKKTQASETAKVSPKKIRMSETAKVSPKKTRMSETAKVSPKKTQANETAKVSPKKTRASQAAVQTSAAGKSLRTRRTTNTQVHNVKKLRASLVVTKKAPVLSPQPDNKATTRGKVDSLKGTVKNTRKVDNTKGKIEVKVTPNKSPAVSPKKRATRRQVVDNSTDKKVETSIKTPKRNTRAKVQKVSLVVSKPSPKMKPVATKAKDTPLEPKRRTRKTTAPSESTDNVKNKQKIESPIESPEKPVTRTRRTTEVIAKSKGRQTKAAVTPKSTRAQAKPEKKSKESPIEDKSRKTRGRITEKAVEVLQDKKNVANDKAAPTRGKKTETKQTKAEVVKATNARNRTDTKQNKDIIEEPKTRGRRAVQTNVVEVAPARGKKAKAIVEVVQESKRTRGKRVETQDSTQSEGKRGQKAKTKVEDKVVPEVTSTRGRRTKANEEVLPESKRTRGKRGEVSLLEGKQGQKGRANVEDKSRKRKSTVESDVPSKLRKTRGEDVAEAKGRGRKAAEVAKEVKGREVAVKNVEKTRATRAQIPAVETETTSTRAGRRPQTKASSEPQAGGRKRKTVADTTDKPSKGRKQPATKKPKVVAESPKKGSRARAAVAEGAKRATRARR